MGSLPSSRQLTGWKEISGYLGTSARTAQKMEEERGLPVHRLPGEKGRVFAFVEELDTWRMSAEGRANSAARSGLMWAAAALALVVGGAGATFHLRAPAAPHSFSVEPYRLTVRDVQGSTIWTAPLATRADTGFYNGRLNSSQLAIFSDINQDGEIETVFVHEPAERETVASTVVAFSSKGKVLWRFEPGRVVSTSGGQFKPPYHVEAIALGRNQKTGDQYLVVTSHHVAWFPNQIAVLSPKGKLVREYWHSGQLAFLQTRDLDQDGADEIYAAGVCNAWRQACLVALTPKGPSGAEDESGHPSYQILNMPEVRATARVLFPRSCFNRLLEPYNTIHDFRWRDGYLAVDVLEKIGSDAGVVYELGPDLRVRAAAIGDRFIAFHRELRVMGRLDHDLTDREMKGFEQSQSLNWPTISAGSGR